MDPVFQHEPLTFPRLKQHNLDIGRVYRVESGSHTGNVYPSITRALGAKPKPALEAWKKRVGKEEAQRVSARATVQGSSLHRLSECYLGNVDLPAFTPNVAELWQFMRPWLASNITKVYAQEQDVYSPRLEIAGRLDLLAEYEGEPAVVDIKTAKAEKREDWVSDYFLQASFYCCAVFELTGLKVKRFVIPIVHPEGLQIFEGRAMDFLPALQKRITEYYALYAE